MTKPQNEPDSITEEVDPYEGVPEVDIDPDFEDDEAAEHLPADMIPAEDEQ